MLLLNQSINRRLSIIPRTTGISYKRASLHLQVHPFFDPTIMVVGPVNVVSIARSSICCHGCWREAQGRGSSSQDAMYTACFPRRIGIDFNSPRSPEASSYCFGASQQNGSFTSWHTAQAALEGRRLPPARHSAPAT